MFPLGTRLAVVFCLVFAAVPYVANAERRGMSFTEEPNLILEDLACQIADGELLPGMVEELNGLGMRDREQILEILSTLIVPEDASHLAATILEFPYSDGPSLNGTRVPWYSRRLQYDSNEKDWDYIYTFRLNTNRFPPNQRLWYGEKWTCWVKRWGFPSTYWGDYYRNGSWYSEYLLGKNTVDWFTCYGYMELEYWY